MGTTIRRHTLRPATGLAAALLASALLAGPPAAHAAPDYATLKAQGPQALLAYSDKRTNDYETQQWVLKMTVYPPSGEPKSLKFKVWQKDRTKRLVRFLEPGEVKGMSMLSRSASVMYVYSPQTDNVRRLAVSARRQTLLGSNLTYSDMASLDFATGYDAALDEETPTAAWLRLTRKPDAKRAWEHLRVRVSRETLMVDRVEYLDGGKVVRTQERSDFEMMDGVPTYRTVTMVDTGSKLKTVLHIESQQIGGPIDDALFKKRNLVRGG